MLGSELCFGREHQVLLFLCLRGSDFLSQRALVGFAVYLCSAVAAPEMSVLGGSASALQCWCLCAGSGCSVAALPFAPCAVFCWMVPLVTTQPPLTS